jgi:hypothetical protein
MKTDKFTQAYIECALWTGVIGTEPDAIEPEYDLDPDLLAPETLAGMIADCADFQESNEYALVSAFDKYGYTDEQAGHDFWLTRNGHGAGFWDRGIDALGDELTRAAKVYGASDLYIGDDGMVYA